MVYAVAVRSSDQMYIYKMNGSRYRSDKEHNVIYNTVRCVYVKNTYVFAKTYTNKRTQDKHSRVVA